jgi:hypothetical protein
MLARISSAVLSQRKGFSFQSWIHWTMSASRSCTDLLTPRRTFLVVSSANQRSIGFSQDPLVGVKCR